MATVKARCNFILKLNFKRTEPQSWARAKVTGSVLKHCPCQHCPCLLLSPPEARVTDPRCGGGRFRSHTGRPPHLHTPVTRAGAPATHIHQPGQTQLRCLIVQKGTILPPRRGRLLPAGLRYCYHHPPGHIYLDTWP